MRMSIRVLSIISCLGAILSVGAAVYSGMHYISLSHSGRALEALVPGEDTIVHKIKEHLSGYKEKDLILRELNARHEHNAALYAALAKMVDASKIRAIVEILLWISTASIFFWILIRSEKSRPRNSDSVRKCAL